jgi:hypothetical protein
MVAPYSYASEDPLGVAGEIVSLVLIVVAFLIMTYLASRTKSRKSFQVEMFFFTVVLIAAEIPRILYSLHIVDLDPLSTVGLGIHSVSMVILTLFVVLRVRGFVTTSHVLRGDFTGVVQSAVESGISTAMGESTMKAMNFYVNSDMALADPNGYAKSLGKIFGTGSGVLLDSIVQNVCEATKVEKREGMSLAAAIAAGRESFMAMGSPLRK